MGSWQVPNKVLLPAEADLSPSVFEFNGRLANGDQVMAYVGSRTGDTRPATTPFTRHTAVVFRFDADGALLACDFATVAHGGDSTEKDPERGYRAARELLFGLVDKVRVEGWASADILVRPFYVMVDDLETGSSTKPLGRTRARLRRTSGTTAPSAYALVPFDRIFRRPWTTGEYDT